MTHAYINLSLVFFFFFKITESEDGPAETDGQCKYNYRYFKGNYDNK